MLIGRRGDTLDALQYLTGLAVNKGREDYKKIMLDAENYRESANGHWKSWQSGWQIRLRRPASRLPLER